MSRERTLKLLEMLDKQPQDTFLLYALGMEELGLQKLEDAAGLFKKVLHIQPDNVACYYQLGKICEQLGAERDAVIHFEEGMRLANLKGDKKTSAEFRTALDELLF